jgi:hypothetical protein
MPRLFLPCTGLIGIVTVLACSDSQAPQPLAECTGPVAVSVGPGLTPTISWTPACRGTALLVDIPGSGTNYWFISTPGDTNGLRPPVKYATVPSGLVAQIAAQSLSTAVQYRATVSRADDSGGIATIVIAGSTTFTP